jgi:hypothetical protein
MNATNCTPPRVLLLLRCVPLHLEHLECGLHASRGTPPSAFGDCPSSFERLGRANERTMLWSALVMLLVGARAASVASHAASPDTRSVVRIEVAAAAPNYLQPWQVGAQEHRRGSGFIISERVEFGPTPSPGGAPARIKAFCIPSALLLTASLARSIKAFCIPSALLLTASLARSIKAFCIPSALLLTASLARTPWV